VTVLDLSTNRIVASFSAPTSKQQYVVSTSSTAYGRAVFVLLGDGELTAYDGNAGTPTASINSFDAHVNNGFLKASPGGSLLVAGVETENSPFIDGAQKYAPTIMLEWIRYR
jgi:hypothetical protein